MNAIGYFGNRSLEADAMSEELIAKDHSVVTSYLLLDHSGISANTEATTANTTPAGGATGTGAGKRPGLPRSSSARAGEDVGEISRMKRRSSFMLAGTVTSKFKTQLAGDFRRISCCYIFCRNNIVVSVVVSVVIVVSVVVSVVVGVMFVSCLCR